jgi:hypothetical protein
MGIEEKNASKKIRGLENSLRHADQLEAIGCEECLQELPVERAFPVEGEDYVKHFCGLACYDRWKAKDK